MKRTSMIKSHKLLLLVAMSTFVDIGLYAAVDGETYRGSDSAEEWSRTGNYSQLTMGVWKDGAEPSDGEMEISADFAKLGLPASCLVRCVWMQKDLGVFKGRFSASIPAHAALLFRLSPM